MKILIVEDEDSLREVMIRSLENGALCRGKCSQLSGCFAEDQRL